MPRRVEADVEKAGAAVVARMMLLVAGFLASAGAPRWTLPSNNQTCQPEKPESSHLKSWPPRLNPGVARALPRWTGPSTNASSQPEKGEKVVSGLNPGG